MCPGAWAPSITVQMPRSRGLGDQRARSGRRSAVGEVMWLRNSTRVRSVKPATIASVNAPRTTSGIGTLTTTISRAGARGHVGPGLLERRVLVVGGQDLVARP